MAPITDTQLQDMLDNKVQMTLKERQLIDVIRHLYGVNDKMAASLIVYKEANEGNQKEYKFLERFTYGFMLSTFALIAFIIYKIVLRH